MRLAFVSGTQDCAANLQPSAIRIINL